MDPGPQPQANWAFRQNAAGLGCHAGWILPPAFCLWETKRLPQSAPRPHRGKEPGIKRMRGETFLQKSLSPHPSSKNSYMAGGKDRLVYGRGDAVAQLPERKSEFVIGTSAV